MAQRIPLSVVVIAKNEEENIRDCLTSVSWADEIIIVDDYSTDRTVAVAREFTDKVFQRKMDVEGTHRNYAYNLAKNAWVLSLDADERVTDELRQEIEAVLPHADDHKAFTIPIRAYLGDYWIRHGGWYPAGKVRLFDRRFFKYEEVEVHPRVFIDGPCGHLKKDIIHYSYRDFSDFLRSVDNQTTLEAKKWFNERRKIGALKAVRKTVDRFLKTYYVKEGRRDGMVGFMVAYFNGLYQLLSYAKYWQMQKQVTRHKSQDTSHRSPVTGKRFEKKLPVTAAIIAKNEEENIGLCLESLGWADEVLVVDGCSTDRTVERAMEYGAKVVQHAFSGSFADDRNIALKTSRNDWVLHIDADDIITEDFVAQLEKALKRLDGKTAVFKFRRNNFFLGHCMRFGGWRHYIPNLVNKTMVRYEGKVHEVPVFSGDIGIIHADIEHHPFKTVSQFVAKQNRYTSIKAEEMFEKEGPMDDEVIWKKMRQKALRTFSKSYLKKAGFRDGFYGFLFGFLFSMIDVLTWAKFWHLCHTKMRTRPSGAR